jgi:hypothetical protein
MLTLSPSAVDAVGSLLQRTEVPDDAGMRIGSAGDPSSRSSSSLSPRRTTRSSSKVMHACSSTPRQPRCSTTHGSMLACKAIRLPSA